MKIRDIIKMVEADGWFEVTQKGRDQQYKHGSKRGRVTIAGYPSADVAAENPEEHLGTGRAEEMKYAIVSATGYSAYAPDLPGCIAAGSSLEETSDLMRGAIAMHLEAMRADGDPIPEPSTRVDYIEAPAA